MKYSKSPAVFNPPSAFPWPHHEDPARDDYADLRTGHCLGWPQDCFKEENYKIKPEVRNWLRHQLSSTAGMIDSRGAALHHFLDLVSGEKDGEQTGTEGWPRINIKLFNPVFDRVLRKMPGTDTDVEGM